MRSEMPRQSKVGRALVDAKLLLVGLGGLGCPTALSLVKAGVGTLVIADDDQVELGNLHRQILFGPQDVGRDKLEAGLNALRRLAPASPTHIDLLHTRILPENARERVRQVDLVIEGSDNFATKFLVADACHLEGIACIHGAAVRWIATAFCSHPHGHPCYRCLFEDIPRGTSAPNCAEAGVMGPVVGLGAALMVEFALGTLGGNPPYGQVARYDGRSDMMRCSTIASRPDCPLCGQHPRIEDTAESRYIDDCEGFVS